MIQSSGFLTYQQSDIFLSNFGRIALNLYNINSEKQLIENYNTLIHFDRTNNNKNPNILQMFKTTAFSTQ